MSKFSVVRAKWAHLPRKQQTCFTPTPYPTSSLSPPSLFPSPSCLNSSRLSSPPSCVYIYLRIKLLELVQLPTRGWAWGGEGGGAGEAVARGSTILLVVVPVTLVVVVVFVVVAVVIVGIVIFLPLFLSARELSKRESVLGPASFSFSRFSCSSCGFSCHSFFHELGNLFPPFPPSFLHVGNAAWIVFPLLRMYKNCSCAFKPEL